MVTTNSMNSINAADMARRIAKSVQGEPTAKQLWFRQLGSLLEFWLVTDAGDLETERRLRRAGRMLYHYFPGALIDFQVVNLTFLQSGDVSLRIPADAELRTIH